MCRLIRTWAIFTLLFGPVNLWGADWPQHFGPNRDGISTETGLAKSWPKDGPKILWQTKVGLGWAAPVIAGDKLVLFHRIENNEILSCLDAKTGKEIWKQAYKTKYVDEFNFEEGPRATPLIADDTIFTLGADGDLSAFQLSDGKAIWARNVNVDYRAPKGFFGVATSPMLIGGKLVVNVGAKGAGVVAFDPKTGKELWKATDHGVSYSSPTQAKIDGENLAIFFTRAGLLAISPEKGEVRYEFPWRPRINASVNAATPLVVGNQIFLSTSYNTGAVLLECAKGEINDIWKGDESLSCHYNTPVVKDGLLYGMDGRQEGRPRLRCVDWKTGKVRWTKENIGCAGLILADGLIFASVESGELLLVEATAEQYQERGRFAALDAPVRAAPALANGILYARDSKKLIAVEVKK